MAVLALLGEASSPFDTIRKALHSTAFHRIIPGMHLHGEIEREADGRWIAEIPEVPGVLVYGATEDEAKRKAVALLYRVLSERAQNGGELVTNLEMEFA